MTAVAINRRDFGHASIVAFTSALVGGASAHAADATATRREVIKQALPGDPPREVVLLEVTYPAGAGSPAHLHANGVMAYVVAGSIASQVGDGPQQIYRAGEAWWEPPGAIHRVSRNASASETATLLAIYIAPKGASPADLMKPI
jgi:quercetin dioxygenase-like cupin family protein